MITGTDQQLPPSPASTPRPPALTPNSQQIDDPPPPAPLFSRLQNLLPHHIHHHQHLNHEARGERHFSQLHNEGQKSEGESGGGGMDRLKGRLPSFIGSHSQGGGDHGKGDKSHGLPDEANDDYPVQDNGDQDFNAEDKITGKRDVLKMRFVTWNM